MITSGTVGIVAPLRAIPSQGDDMSQDDNDNLPAEDAEELGAEMIESVPPAAPPKPPAPPPIAAPPPPAAAAKKVAPPPPSPDSPS